TPEEVDEKVAAVEKSGLETGYDVAAIVSYKVFRKLKDEGVIPSHVRFQVAFPTIPNVILPFISKVFQERIAPLYEKALFKAMRNTQDSIPHEDLSIQIDIAGDTALWEATKREAKGTALEYYQPWWQGDVRDYMVAYMMRMFAEVDQDVELGIHNCYGDMDHKHWFEPPSLEVVVERGIRIYEETPHPINYFHCPVPKSATAQYGPGDNLDAYLAPLKDLVPHLEKHNTELYLGVVHEEHLELTRAMIAAAQKVVPNFGAAMECGGGRMQKDKFENALSIAKQV
ncbi:uncharacterized protein K489DRAFT_299836, partial [Dissoconium aciculare CBS 342.82]|uniref:Cobalamin-independent methionine synthase MetE C-terminal/archaeal domain-containing protein n=1 Tax=Dissoconium aciculare CBS 342.82 TaxID=1314786 RepID=A0A6J3M8W0_9PEZI